jgi:hypothetical protein
LETKGRKDFLGVLNPAPCPQLTSQLNKWEKTRAHQSVFQTPYMLWQKLCRSHLCNNTKSVSSSGHKNPPPPHTKKRVPGPHSRLRTNR